MTSPDSLPPAGSPSLSGLHLHFDCASGIAGDMTLGAPLDLGVPLEGVTRARDQVGAGGWRLTAARCVRGGVAAVNVTVATRGHLDGIDAHSHDHERHEHGHERHEHGHERHEHGHERHEHHEHGHERHEHGHERHEHGHERHEHHEHGHHEHGHDPASGHGAEAAESAQRATARYLHGDYDHGHPHHHAGGGHVHYRDLRRLIADSALGADAKALALDMFDRLARAEAKLHGAALDTVAFHEVGAIDAVVDIVGTAAAWCYLAPVGATCAQVAMGHGTLRCAHGILPVPAPAALEILREAGGVLTDGRCARELCTPTGAAILAATVTRWSPMPTGRAVAVGWGAGDLELSDRPNAVRLTALAPAQVAPGAADEPVAAVWQIEANVDDMSPELCGPALEAAFAAGALDVWWTPITMKKGRPALLLSALVPAERRDAVTSAILRETTTIGVRFAPRWRQVLERSHAMVATSYGPIPVKVARDAGQVVNAAPELEDCVRAAREHAVPLKEVLAAAMAAWRRTLDRA